MIDALRLIADAAVAQAFKFSPEEVRYILWHKDTAAGTYRPTDAVIGTFLTALRDGLAALPVDATDVDRQTLVVDRVASAFRTTNAATDAFLRTYLHARGASGAIDTSQSPLTLLTALAGLTGVVNSSTAAAAWYTYLHVQKVATVVARLKLADVDLAWTFLYGPLGFDALPVVQTTVPSAFLAWSRLINAAALRADFADGALFDLFYAAAIYSGGDPTGARAAVIAVISTRTGWNGVDLLHFAQNLSPALVYPADFQDERGLVRLKNAIGMTKRLDLPAATVLPWSDVSFGTATAGADALTIKEAVRGTFAPEAWPSAATAARNGIRERQRDAMVGYLVGTSTTPVYADANALSDDILMDVQVMSCAKTSRIKQALSSTQTFIQRVFLNYETTVAFNTDDARQWQWMKSFRLWEANRKIFLYPENWIEPTLRDDNSELFERLQTDLSKGELTKDLIEDALVSYLQGLDEISHLDPIASVVEEDSELKRSRFHVVARTKAHPPVHYYRARETNGAWVGWRKLDVDVQSDHVLVTLYNRRPYLLWATFDARPLTETATTKHYSERLRWTTLHLAKWGKVRQSTAGITDFGGLKPGEELADRKAESLSFRSTFDGVTGDLLLETTEVISAPKFPALLNLTPWSSRFRLTGGQGVPIIEGATKNERTLFPSYAYASANFYVHSAYAQLDGLGLPDVFNYYPKEVSSGDVKSLDLLGATPSPYELLTTGSNDNMWAYDPVFYSDARRCFIVVPSASTTQPKTTSSPMTPPTAVPDSTNQVVKVWAWGGPLVTDKINFAQNPPSGGDNYSSKLLSNVTAVSRPTTHTAFAFSPFYHPFVRDVLTQLNRLGVDGMYDPQPGKPGAELRRQAKSTAYFAADYDPTEWVDKAYPVDEFDFSRAGAYSLYNWELFFHVPLLIATKLAADQQFDEARKWFHYIFNPTEPKAPASTEDVPQRFWKVKPFFTLSAPATVAEGPVQILKLLLSHDNSDPVRVAARKVLQDQVEEWRENPFEPHRIARLRPVAYMKTVVIKYLDMLLAWGDQLFARATLESINEALQIYITAFRVLGARPTKLPPQSPPVFAYDDISSSLDAFSDALETALPPVTDDVEVSDVDEAPIDQKSMFFCVPPNDKLLGYWDVVEDRLYKIRHCLNLQGIAVDLPLFEPPIDPGLLVRARAAGVDIGSLLADVSAPLPLQRYAVLAQRANELVAEVKSLGQSVLSALEKNDAEALGLLRAGQEIQVMGAMRVSKAQSVEDTARAREALEKSREALVARRDYYAGRPFMNAQETEQMNAASKAAEQKLSAQALQAVAGVLQAIPNFDIGTSGNGGHSTLVTGGTMYASILSIEASVLGVFATWNESKAQLAGTQGGYQRRKDDWDFQQSQAVIEIANLDKQIAAAKIREAIAANDLEAQDLQIQNSIDVRDFMRDKFTNIALYDWMVSQLSAVYFQGYKLAFDAAKRAERAWAFEIGEETSTSSFITFGYWEGLQKGLLAGERLAHDIKRMEMAYLDKNKREFELVRHLPMTSLAPLALQELRETGTTTVNIQEPVFDADTAGHYFRRLRNVSVTIAGVTGPYTSVRCTLTLLASSIRRQPTLTIAPVASTLPLQSIVTSTGRDDGGLFETNLHDERYLPFEGAGAISTWRIELPKPNATSSVEPHALPLFDYRTISEFVFHLRYTARDGGLTLRAAVNAATGPLNNVQWKIGFSVKNVFSDAWFRFVSGTAAMTLALDADHLPFKAATAEITAVELVRVRKPPPGGSNFNLALTPPSSSPSTFTMTPVGNLGNQHAVEVAYGSHKALGDWSLAHSTDLLADDDLFVIVTYVLPAAP